MLLLIKIIVNDYYSDRQYAKFLTCLAVPCSLTCALKKALSLSPFYRWGNWSRACILTLFMVSCTVGSKAKAQITHKGQKP